jgi:hypothetical protein
MPYPIRLPSYPAGAAFARRAISTPDKKNAGVACYSKDNFMVIYSGGF